MVTTRYLKVTNIQKNCSESDIHNLFNKFGFIENLELFDLNGFYYFIISFMDIKSASRAFVSDIFFHGSKVKMEYYDPSTKVGLQFLDKNHSESIKRLKNQKYIYEKDSHVNICGKVEQEQDFMDKRQVSTSSENQYPVNHRGLKISRLPPQKTEDQIRQGLTAEFRRFGRIASILVLHDKNSTMNGNRAAILTFRRREDASRAYHSTRSGEKVIFATRAMIEPHFGLPTVDSQECSSPSSSSSSAASPITNSSSLHGHEEKDIRPVLKTCPAPISSVLKKQQTSSRSEDLENMDKKHTNLLNSNAIFSNSRSQLTTANINGSLLHNNHTSLIPNNNNNNGLNSLTRTLYIAGLTKTTQGSVSREQLTTAFKKFGDIEHVQMRHESSSAFIQFSEMRGPLRAMTAHSRDPLKLGGRLLKLAYVPSIPTSSLWIADLPHQLAQLTDSCLLKKFKSLAPISEIVLIYRNIESLEHGPTNNNNNNNNNNSGKNSQTAAFIKVPSITDASNLLKELRTRENLTKFLNSISPTPPSSQSTATSATSVKPAGGNNIRPFSVDYAGQRQSSLVANLKSQKNGNLLKSSNINYLRKNQIRVIPSNGGSSSTTPSVSSPQSKNYSSIANAGSETCQTKNSLTNANHSGQSSEKLSEDSRWKAAALCKLTNPIIKTVSSMSQLKKSQPANLNLSQSSTTESNQQHLRMTPGKSAEEKSQKRYRSSSLSSSTSSSTSSSRSNSSEHFIKSPISKKIPSSSSSGTLKKASTTSQYTTIGNGPGSSSNTSKEKYSSSMVVVNTMRKNLSQLKEDLNSARNSISSSIKETNKLFSHESRNDISDNDNYETMYDKIKRRNKALSEKSAKDTSKKKKNRKKKRKKSKLKEHPIIKEKRDKTLIRRSLGISFPSKAQDISEPSESSCDDDDTTMDQHHHYLSVKRKSSKSLSSSSSTSSSDFNPSSTKTTLASNKRKDVITSSSSDEDFVDITPRRKSVETMPIGATLVGNSCSSSSSRKRPKKKLSSDSNKVQKKQARLSSTVKRKASSKTSSNSANHNISANSNTNMSTTSGGLVYGSGITSTSLLSASSQTSSSQQLSNSFEALLNSNYSNETKEGPFKYAKSLQSSVFFRRLQQQQLSHEEDVTFEDLNDDEFERLSAATPSTEPMENDGALTSSSSQDDEDENLFEEASNIQMDQQSFISDNDNNDKKSSPQHMTNILATSTIFNEEIKLWPDHDGLEKKSGSLGKISSPKMDDDVVTTDDDDDEKEEKHVIPGPSPKPVATVKNEQTVDDTNSHPLIPFKKSIIHQQSSHDQSAEIKTSPSISSSSPSSGAIASYRWDNIGNISSSCNETVLSPPLIIMDTSKELSIKLDESVNEKCSTGMPISASTPKQQLSGIDLVKILPPSTKEDLVVGVVVEKPANIVDVPDKVPIIPVVTEAPTNTSTPKVQLLASKPVTLQNNPKLTYNSSTIPSLLIPSLSSKTTKANTTPCMNNSTSVSYSTHNHHQQQQQQQQQQGGNQISSIATNSSGPRWSSRCNVDSTVEGAIIGDVQTYVRGVIERVTAESCSSTNSSSSVNNVSVTNNSKKNQNNSNNNNSSVSIKRSTEGVVVASCTTPVTSCSTTCQPQQVPLPSSHSSTSSQLLQIPGVNACITPKSNPQLASGNSPQQKLINDPYEMNFDETPLIAKLTTTSSSSSNVVGSIPTITLSNAAKMPQLTPLPISSTNIVETITTLQPELASTTSLIAAQKESVDNVIRDVVAGKFDAQSYLYSWRNKSSTKAPAPTISQQQPHQQQGLKASPINGNGPAVEVKNKSPPPMLNNASNNNNNSIVTMIIDALKSLPGLQVHTVGNDFLLSNSNMSVTSSGLSATAAASIAATNQLFKEANNQTTTVTNMTLPLVTNVHGGSGPMGKIPPSATTISATTITLPVTAAAAGIKNLQAVMMQQQAAQKSLQVSTNQFTSPLGIQQQQMSQPMLTSNQLAMNPGLTSSSSSLIANGETQPISNNIFSLLSNIQKQQQTPPTSVDQHNKIPTSASYQQQPTIGKGTTKKSTIGNTSVSTTNKASNSKVFQNVNISKNPANNLVQSSQHLNITNPGISKDQNDKMLINPAVNQEFPSYLRGPSNNGIMPNSHDTSTPPNTNNIQIIGSNNDNSNSSQNLILQQQQLNQESLLLKNFSQRLLTQDPANLHLMMNLLQSMATTNPENKAANMTNESLLLHTLQTFMTAPNQTSAATPTTTSQEKNILLSDAETNKSNNNNNCNKIDPNSATSININQSSMIVPTKPKQQEQLAIGKSHQQKLDVPVVNSTKTSNSNRKSPMIISTGDDKTSNQGNTTKNKLTLQPPLITAATPSTSTVTITPSKTVNTSNVEQEQQQTGEQEVKENGSLPQSTMTNDTNQLERIVQDYPFVWQGRLSLKNSEARVALHYIHGNINLLNCCMKLLATLTASFTPGTTDIMDAPLKIVQRMRMELPQLEAVHRKMSQDNDYCACLALASGKNPEDLCHQTQILSDGFIKYMQEKGAAGIINACLPDQQTEGQYIVHIFPPCEFSFNKLAGSAPALYQSVMKKDIPHLLVVITTV